MRHALREPFSSGATAIVTKPFAFNGKDFAKGDKFPWKKLGCSLRKARQLWENRFISNGEEAPEPTTPKAEAKPKQGPKAAPAAPAPVATPEASASASAPVENV